MDWTGLTATVNGMVMLTPCLTFEIFLNVTDDAGLLDFYDRCRDTLADRPVRIDSISGLGAGFMTPETNRWLNAFDADEAADG